MQAVPGRASKKIVQCLTDATEKMDMEKGLAKYFNKKVAAIEGN